MTSTADTGEHTGRHPEAAELSALSEGILPPDRSAELRSHLVSCPLCADVRSSLDEIRELLGTLPGPTRMPDDVAGRIDAALAAEALISSTVSRGPDSGTPGTETRDTETPGTETPKSGMPGTRALGTGTPESGMPGTRAPDSGAPEGHEADSGAAEGREAETPVSRETSTRPRGHATAPTGPGRPRRRRWGRVLLVTACAAVAVGGGSVIVRSLVATGTPHVSATGHASAPGTFSGTALADRVHELLAVAGPSNAPRTRAQAGNTPMSSGSGSPAVPPCVLQGTGRTDRPLGSARGSYEGRTAYLLILVHPAHPSRVDAFVLDASCISAAAPMPAHVMTQVTYNR